MAKYCFVKFNVTTKDSVEEVYLVGNTKNLGNWDTKKAVKMTKLSDNTFKVQKRFLIGENVEYKVLATKVWENVEKGIFNEEVENHHFEGAKGHFEDIFVHYFN